MKTNAILLSAFLLGASATPGFADRHAGLLKRWEFAEPHLGTQARLVIWAETEPKTAAQAAFACMEKLNRIYSDYDDTSELMQLCRQPVGQPLALSATLFTVLERAQAVADETKGAFDITIGPYSQLWRRARRQKKVPAAEALAKAKEAVGHGSLRLDARARTATLLKPGMRLDLGGIAKGAVVQDVRDRLREQGFRHAMVSLGGDLALGAAPPGEDGWKVQVASAPKEEPAPSVLLANCCISTSGDLEQFLELDGKRYSHIIDPQSGWGVEGSRLVTVIAPQGMDADAYSTAFSVMSPESGLALAEQMDGVAVRWILPRDQGPPRVVESSGWKRLRWANR